MNPTLRLPRGCRVLGLLAEMPADLVRKYEWNKAGMPRKHVVRYTVEGTTYLVAGHPYTHSQALKPELRETATTAEAFTPEELEALEQTRFVSAADIIKRTRTDWDGAELD